MTDTWTGAPARLAGPTRLRAAWLRAADLLESDQSGSLLAVVGLLVLTLSLAAAVAAVPAGAPGVIAAAVGAGAGMLGALGLRRGPRILIAVSTLVGSTLVGVYVATAYDATPTVVWLFAFMVPAVGMARGPLLGAAVGFVAAPILHFVETGVVFDPVDPQGPFGILILIALGAAPGHLLQVARERRASLKAELTRAVVLLDETERARQAEHSAKQQSVFMLARAAEARDGTTGAHIYHVRDLATALAGATGADAKRAELIGWSAMLHDVGKLRVPDRILLKPGKLEPDDWETIKQHSAWGEELLDGEEHFQMARGIARWHHENWDGSGYPDGISANSIPFEARIVRIVDVYDALRAERPYKRAWTEEETLEELHRMREIHFDPDLTDLFLKLRSL